MSGNGEQAPPQPVPPLIISVRKDGKGVEVKGPLNNKELCWRMLTDAAVAILNFKPSPIIQPVLVPPKDLGKLTP